jgi:hypothetical protein
VSEPIVFISHFRVNEGKLESFRRFFRDGAPLIGAQKPRTVAFLAYADEQAGRVSIVHVFPDAEAMSRHFEGADERSAAAYEFITPDGFEIYGQPSADVVGTMQTGAASAGVTLSVTPGYAGGFLRLTGGME